MFSPDGLLRHVAPEMVAERLSQGWVVDGSDELSTSPSARDEARKIKSNAPPNRVTKTKR